LPFYLSCLAAAMLLIGTNVGLGKSVIVFFPVLLFTFLRFGIAVICLLPWLRPARMRRISRKEWLQIFLQAFFGTFLFTLFMLYGVRYTTAMAAGVITSAIPASVAIVSWLVLRERLSRRTALSVALAIGGILILNLSTAQHSGSNTAENALLGNLFVLGAVICEGLYVILSRSITQTVPPMENCAYTHLFGFLLILPFGVAVLPGFDFSAIPVYGWSIMLWYVLSASIFSFALWATGIRHVPATLAGVFTSLVPLAAAAYGILVLGETPGWGHAVAMVCVLAGIAVACWPSKPFRHALTAIDDPAAPAGATAQEAHAGTVEREVR
jgi:drug/metabolite transporter (DMT)-like permease